MKAISITTKDIARLAQVSQSTVSRCLNNSSLISDETKLRVLKIAAEHGFQFNASARSLSTKKTRTIGIICLKRMFDNAFDIHYWAWQNALIEKLEQHDYDVIISLLENRFTGQNNIQKLIAARKVDGLIILQQEVDEATVKLLETSGIPHVFCKYLPAAYNGKAVDYVFVDQFQGGYMATRHLLEEGHQKILCLTADIPGGEFTQRTAGYRAALEDNGLAFAPELVLWGDTTFAGGETLIYQQLAQLPPFTAIFAQTDLMALGAISALRQLGVKVPEDIGVVGYDNTNLCTYLEPHLTSVHQPFAEVAMLTVSRLLDSLEGRQNIRQRQAVAPQLIIRQSCGAGQR